MFNTGKNIITNFRPKILKRIKNYFYIQVLNLRKSRFVGTFFILALSNHKSIIKFCKKNNIKYNDIFYNIKTMRKFEEYF